MHVKVTFKVTQGHWY